MEPKSVATKIKHIISMVYPILIMVISVVSLIVGSLLSTTWLLINLILLSILVILNLLEIRSKDEIIITLLAKLSLSMLERNKLRNLLNKHNIKEES